MSGCFVDLRAYFFLYMAGDGFEFQGSVSRMKVLVTGANGFVGQALCSLLHEQGYDVVCAVRRGEDLSRLATVIVGDIDEKTDWCSALSGIDAVVHLASRVHVMDECDAQAEEAFQRINVRGSEQLARQAVKAGVKRFVFVSSIKVNGEATHGIPFREEDVPCPDDAYGRSKHGAEQALNKVAGQTGLELVVVRPPMVVGPTAKGNLPILIKALLRNLPLPLAGLRNRRSFIGVSNLASLIERCLVVPEAAGEVFLVADEPPLSTTVLIRHLARGVGRRALLWYLPRSILQQLGSLFGKQAQIDRLTGDLEIDASKARRILAWQPVESLEEALYRASRYIMQGKGQIGS